MLRLRGHRHTGGEAGFTLIEILVVVLLIAVLAGIAIPTFQGAKRSGWDSKAQATLRSGLAAVRTYYVDYQEYTDSATELGKIEPNLDWTTSDADAQGVAVALHSSRQVIVLVSTSTSGNQFCIMNIAVDLTTLDPPVTGGVNGLTEAGTFYKRNPNAVSTPPTSVSVDQCGSSGYTRSDTGW